MIEFDNLGDMVVLQFLIFIEIVEMVGISCVLGGYYIQVDNVVGFQLGCDVVYEVWKFYLKYIGEVMEEGQSKL